MSSKQNVQLEREALLNLVSLLNLQNQQDPQNESPPQPQTSRELIQQEVEKITQRTQQSLQAIKKIAVAEAWKVLQITVASVVQVIEIIGQDLTGPDKKALAMDLISNFYDKSFTIVDIPVVPTLMESIIHKYVKTFLMILVSSSIDATVTIFRNTGVFLKKYS